MPHPIMAEMTDQDAMRAWRSRRRNEDLGVWPSTVSTGQSERMASDSDLPLLRQLPRFGRLPVVRLPDAPRRTPWRLIAAVLAAGWIATAAVLAWKSNVL